MNVDFLFNRLFSKCLREISIDQCVVVYTVTVKSINESQHLGLAPKPMLLSRFVVDQLSKLFHQIDLFLFYCAFCCVKRYPLTHACIHRESVPFVLYFLIHIFIINHIIILRERVSLHGVARYSAQKCEILQQKLNTVNSRQIVLLVHYRIYYSLLLQ